MKTWIREPWPTEETKQTEVIELHLGTAEKEWVLLQQISSGSLSILTELGPQGHPTTSCPSLPLSPHFGPCTSDQGSQHPALGFLCCFPTSLAVFVLHLGGKNKHLSFMTPLRNIPGTHWFLLSEETCDISVTITIPRKNVFFSSFGRL